MNEEKQQELQQKYMEMQMIQQHLQQYQKQAQMFENQYVELMSISQSLSELKETKKDKEMLAMLSPGIFVKAKLLDNSELIVNVGAGVAVKKDIEGTKKLLEEQVDEVKKLQKQIMDEMQKLALKSQSIENELSRLVE